MNILLTHQADVPKELGDPRIKPYLDASIDVVIFGHSHIALQRKLGPVLFFNPGAAGKRRFKLVPSVGTLSIGEGDIQGTIYQI